MRGGFSACSYYEETKMVHQDIRIGFIVALLFGVAGHYANATLSARFVFSRPQQYLVKGERTGKDFLRCEGGYSNSSMTNVRVSVTFQGSTFSFIAPDASSYYMFNCTPQMMMPPNNGFAPVNAAFCVLGFKSAEERQAGTYACRVASPSSYFHDAYVQLPLRVYDKFILNTTVQNPKELYVDEHQRFSLSCRVNLQKNLTDLELHLKSTTRYGHFEKIWSLSSTKRTIYEYEVSSASRNDDGIYQCVIVSINDGTKVIDLGSRTAVRIRFAPVANLSSRPIPIQKKTVTLDNHHTEDYLNCSVVGYPTNITITHNNASLVSIDQPNDTLVLKLSVADSESGLYCCQASNALGSDNTCLTVIHGSDSQWQEISVYSGIAVGSGLLVLLILSTIIAHVKKKNRERRSRRGSRRFSQNRDAETDFLLPTEEEQIDFVSELFFESTWEDFRDFCRMMVPRLKEKPFFEDVTKKRAEELEASDKDKAYWRKYCLKAWIEKNRHCSFLQSVYDALRNGIKDKTLAIKLCRRFPHLRLGESLEMSGLIKNRSESPESTSMNFYFSRTVFGFFARITHVKRSH